MDFFNALRGLKKSQSGPNLSFSERISLSRRSANHGKQHRDGLSSPLPPRPPSRNGGGQQGIPGKSSSGLSGRIIENIPENRVVEAAKRGPGGAGLSNNSTYVTPQELRIQGEGSKGTCMVKQLQFIGEFLVSWLFLGDFSDPSLISNVADPWYFSTGTVRIRIRGFVPLTNGSPDPAVFVIDLLVTNKKILYSKFFCLLLFEGTFT
jgi:hypothetical protein